MQKKIKKTLVLMAGIIFIILGLFGLVLPFLQGIIFLLIGFILISFCIPKVRTMLRKHTENHHHASALINKVETALAKFVGDM